MSLRYPEDDDLNIARGIVKGTSVRNIFGLASAMTSGSFKACWENDTAYTYLSSVDTLDVVSSVTTDTAVTVKLIGLDSEYNEIEEVISLDGTDSTTPVTTQQSFFRVNDLVTIAGNATGDVTVTDTTLGTTTVAKMLAGTGRNQASIYTVPAGCDFFLTRINAFSTNVSGTPKGEVGTFRNFVGLPSGVNLRVAEVDFASTMEIMRVVPFKYSEKTDIQLQSQVYSTHSTSIFAEGIVIKRGLG